jgi:hypothetical protein
VDGRASDVIVNVNFRTPLGWTLDDASGDISYEQIASFDKLMMGFKTNVTTPMDEVVIVHVDPQEFDLMHILDGVTVRVEGYGLLLPPEEGGDDNKKKKKKTKPKTKTKKATENITEEAVVAKTEQDGIQAEAAGEEEKEEFVRGDLVVHYEIDWSGMTKRGLKELLKVGEQSMFLFPVAFACILCVVGIGVRMWCTSCVVAHYHFK